MNEQNEEVQITPGAQEHLDARMALYNQIADQADELKSEDGLEELVEGEEPQVEATGQETTELTVPSAEAQVTPDKYIIKVNGREKEVTLDELKIIAQKVESADQYLEEASRLRKNLSQPPAPAVVEPEVDDLALVRAIQMGSEEEAVNAIRKIRTSVKPSVDPDNLAHLIDERLSFQEAAAKFKSEFPDIFKDERLLQIVLQEDQALAQAGDTRPYYERFKSSGEKVRQWAQSLAPQATQPNTLQDKKERKATLAQVPTAATRATPKVEVEEDDSPSSVIAEMARKRGQR